MRQVLHPLFALLASVTRQELARHVAYLMEENRILRSKLPKQITVTVKERNRLVKVGKKLGAQIKDLISIVTYGPFLRWVRLSAPVAAAKKGSSRKPGRSRTPEEIRELILKLARENDWGYTRILGALRKLGIRGVSRQTVKNILKKNRRPIECSRCALRHRTRSPTSSLDRSDPLTVADRAVRRVRFRQPIYGKPLDFSL